MITVIIPALNESATIGAVVEFAWRDTQVSEVLVVDDGSVDGTPELARAAGATVIPSTLLGKGASMEDGMWAARNEMLVYLDGDLCRLREDLIATLTAPLLAGQADFVKAKFSRTAGRVTVLTARPLLRVFFPEAASFSQPLGGIIAARRSLLRRLRFENDYGVDMGLLLDAVGLGARLAEADIGHVEHDSQALEALGEMAAQVVRTILERAARYGRLRLAHIREVTEAERHLQADFDTALRRFDHVSRLALFDMDGTLLDGRFIVQLARRTNRTAELAQYLDNHTLPADERTRCIGAVFRGISRRVFAETAQNIPLMPTAMETVIALRKLGYRVGIVTDSFRIAAEIVRRRVFADFCIAHLMRFHRERATGEVTVSPAMMHPDGCAAHAWCKVNALSRLAERWSLDPRQIVAVGDGENDACMLRAAGWSFAYRPKSAVVQAAARFVLHGELAALLPALTNEPRRLAA